MSTLSKRASAAKLPRPEGPFVFCVVALLLAKVARVIELAARQHSLSPIAAFPLALGEDLMLCACVGLLALGTARLRRRAQLNAIWSVLLVPLALLLPADVLAYKLTGAPITLRRLRGDEGATLGDLDLLAPLDLGLGIAGIVFGLVLLGVCLWRSPSTRWLRRWLRPRALLVTLLVGYGLQLGLLTLSPRSAPLGDQPLFVLAGSLIEPDPLTGLTLTEREWEELHDPDDRRPSPPLELAVGEPARNAIIFLAEGIDYGHTGFAKRFSSSKYRGPNPTPNLVRRHKKHGLVFDRYYANWHASIQAIFSVACSAFPPMQGDIVHIKPRIDCGELSEVARARGLLPGLFHGGLFSFYDKLALLGRRGYDAEIDAAELRGRTSRAKNQWGVDDRAMVDATLEWIDRMPKDQRFVAWLIPITAHYPYWVPRDFKRPFKGGSREQQFLNAVAFGDQVLEQLATGLEKRGLYDDTLILWLGDHGHYVDEPERVTPGLRGFYEPNLHTPLVLLNPKLFGQDVPRDARHSDRLGSHPDLLPTILDALDLPDEPRHQGQSLLGERHRARRVFFGADNGRFAGFIDGDRKFVTSTRKQHVEYYDLKADRRELHDLSQSDPDLMERYRDLTIRFARAVQARFDAAPVLKERLSVEQVYDVYLKHVRVRLTDKAGAQTECGTGGSASCPGLGKPLRLFAGSVQGKRRRCVMVKVPEEGGVSLTVEHPDVLGLLSGTMLAMPGRPQRDPMFKVVTTTDGERGPGAFLAKDAEVRPGHPRPRRSIEMVFERWVRKSGRLAAGDGGVPAQPLASKEAPEVCLQLTAH